MRAGPAQRSQLTRDELQQLRWLLGGVLTLLGLGSVAYLEVEGGALMVLTGVTSLATTLWPTLPARVPRVMTVLAFPVIAGFFALDLWLRSELLPAMIRLDLLLLLYRALVYRQRRDDLQIVVLGLFLVVVAGVLTVSLLFAVQLLAYTAGALALLLLLTMLESTRPELGGAPGAAAGHALARTSPGVPPAWAVHLHWRRLLARVALVAEWRVVALGSALFLGVIGVSAVLFLAIPRFQLDNGMFLDRFVSRQARTGFSDAIKFGDVTAIQQDSGVAFHVDVSDPGRLPRAPYWRMLVLDEYANGTFRASPGLRRRRFERPRTGSMVFGSGRLRRDRVRWTVYLEPGVSRYLPLLAPFQQLKFAEPQTYRNAPDLALLALAKDPVTMTAYQVETFDLTARARDLPGGYFGEDASSGSLDPEEKATLRSLAGEAGGPGRRSPADFAARVCAWLRQRHAYSLSPRVPIGPGDPLVRWVNSHEVGHCELFAGSFVVLARAAGYRARVVTGFRGGAWNAFSNSFTVHNSNAHAWAEIFDPASGSWLRADPLEAAAGAPPAAGAAAPVFAGADRSWSARLDGLRVFWYRRVVSFDEQAQVQTLKVAKELARASLARLRQRLQSRAADLRTWLRRPLDGRRAVTLALAAAAGIAVALGWRRVRVALLELSFWRGPGRRDDPIRREAARWLKRLARIDSSAGLFSAVVLDLQRLRFGRRSSWPDASRVFRNARLAARKRNPREAGRAFPPAATGRPGSRS